MVTGLSDAGLSAMTRYVDQRQADMSRQMRAWDEWPLGQAWRAAISSQERSSIAAAICFREDALAEPNARIIGFARKEPDAGGTADPLLCIVADDLELE